MPDTMDPISAGFTWVDYIVFVAMLASSAGIGLYYGCFKKREDSTKEFLVAGRSMSTIPVALSLVASFMSSVAVLGPVGEVYEHGYLYWLLPFPFPLICLCVSTLYLPVFWDLQVTSAYEYLERRFDRKVRLLASCIFLFQMLLYNSVVIYAPSVALAQVTQIPVYISVTVVSFVCIFYTSIGGMKAVIWTDAIQMIIMIGSLLFIVIAGSLEQGGFGVVWERASRGNRTELINFDPDPRTRHSFWTLFVGGFFMWMSLYAVSQTQVQRYMSVKKKSIATRAIWVNCLGVVVIMSSTIFCGIIVYSQYADCDVISQGIVRNSNQLLPYFVTDFLGHWTGLPGLFIAGVFSGTLSTVSSAINSLAAITLEDFVKGSYPNINEHHATTLSKVITLIYGLIIYGLIFVAEKLGNVASAAIGIHGIVGGPLLGAFTLGMFVPSANSLGTFLGSLTGMIIILWISVGQQISFITGRQVLSKLPINKCVNETFDLFDVNGTEYMLDYASNTSVIYDLEDGTAEDTVLEIYKVSYMWFAAIGFFVTMVIGTVVSLASGGNTIKESDRKLFSPIIRHFITPQVESDKVESSGSKTAVEL